MGSNGIDGLVRDTVMDRTVSIRWDEKEFRLTIGTVKIKIVRARRTY